VDERNTNLLLSLAILFLGFLLLMRVGCTPRQQQMVKQYLRDATGSAAQLGQTVRTGINKIRCFDYSVFSSLLDFKGLTKDEYLTEYRDFIKYMHTNYHDFTFEDWEKSEKILHQYSHNYYRYYKAYMTDNERLEVNKFPILYHLSRYKRLISDEISTHYKRDGQILRKSVQDVLQSSHPEEVLPDSLIEYYKESVSPVIY